MARDYSWRIETALPREEVAEMLQPYRPFRLQVSFSNGFSTASFPDETAYATREPLAKLHYFASRLSIGPRSRVLDVGSHLGHYGHHFLRAGAASYTGIEFDLRTHKAASTLAEIAGLAPTLLNMDFGDDLAGHDIAALGSFDTVICLAVLNNIRNSQLALRRLAERASDLLVIEYAAIESDQAICEFAPDGHGPDRSHLWWFSEPFMDKVLASHDMEKIETTLRWRSDKHLGAGRSKIFSIYRRVRRGAS